MMVSCNIIDDVAAGCHNFMEFNWTAHTRDQAEGANVARLDGSGAWLPYRPAAAYAATSAATFVGPYRETMIPREALILRDFSCVPDGPATAYFWSAGHIHDNPSSTPLRGHIAPR